VRQPCQYDYKEDVKACLLYLTATWAKWVNGFVPGDIPIGRSYPHYLFAHPDLEQARDAPKAGVDTLPIYFTEGLYIMDIKLKKHSLASLLLTQHLNASPLSVST
jgi:hypothetical protein